MKLIIVLKKTDAEGLGGEILEAHGMTRSRVEPGVFAMVAPVHAVDKLGMGDASWSQAEATTQQVIEALMDYGIRPMRIFQRTDSTAGLTPINASTGAPEKVEAAGRKWSTSNPLTMKDTLSVGDESYTVMDLVGMAKGKGRAVATKYGTKKRQGTYSAKDIEYFYLVVDLDGKETIIGVPKKAWDKAKVKDITPKEDEDELTQFLVTQMMNKKLKHFNEKVEFNMWAQGKSPQQKLDYLKKLRGSSEEPESIKDVLAQVEDVASELRSKKVSANPQKIRQFIRERLEEAHAALDDAAVNLTFLEPVDMKLVKQIGDLRDAVTKVRFR